MGVATTDKARLPTVDNEGRWTISDDDDVERRRLRPQGMTAEWICRYGGVVPCKHLVIRKGHFSTIHILDAKMR